mmetsp:Transcript_25608/g.65096  ORF Transcript_25608/g.65096 Transcript_25608/m.65096 type:complete len:209 (-) Transcript_25608:644-1270(-)
MSDSLTHSFPGGTRDPLAGRPWVVVVVYWYLHERNSVPRLGFPPRGTPHAARLTDREGTSPARLPRSASLEPPCRPMRLACAAAYRGWLYTRGHPRPASPLFGVVTPLPHTPYPAGKRENPSGSEDGRGAADPAPPRNDHVGPRLGNTSLQGIRSTKGALIPRLCRPPAQMASLRTTVPSGTGGPSALLTSGQYPPPYDRRSSGTNPP